MNTSYSAEAEYNLSQFETEEFDVLKVANNKNAAHLQRRKKAEIIKSVVLIALLLALTVSFLNTRSQLTAISDEIDTLQAQIVEEKSYYDQLRYQLTGETSQDRVEEYATHQLGMVKADKSQVVYLHLNSENAMETAATGWEKCKEKMQTNWNSIKEYFGD